MADNLTTPVAASTVIATDELTRNGTLVHVPITKIAFGADNSFSDVDAANRFPVDVGTVPVTGTFWPATQPVSGTVSVSGSVAVTGPLTDAELRAAPVPVSIADPVAVTGTFFQATQPVSAASLPLPTGAASEVTLASIDTTLGGTLAISAAALPLPAGAATEATLGSIDTALSGTLAVSAAALPLPAGAATLVKQDEVITSISELRGPDYETVAASVSDQVLGGTGAAGDVLNGLLIIPAATSPGPVSVKDGAGGAITLFAGGAGSIGSLHPFPVPFGATSTSGAWSVTTGADVSVVAIGSFS